MLLSILYILVSFLLLYFGANLLVKGSSALALKAGMSPLVAGLTIVAFGTSSPGLFFSINSVLSGHGNMAIGGALGSNLFNICIVLGILSLVSPLKVKMQLLKIHILVLVAATTLFIVLFADRQISLSEGFILLIVLLIYTVANIYLSRREKNTEVLEEFSSSIPGGKKQWYWSVGMIVLGIGILIAGSELLVKGAVEIAHKLGVGETIISFTIIAAGTSIPLLVSSIIATIHKKFDLAIGIIIGSSIFNILGIIGVSAVIHPLETIILSNIDLLAIFGITLFLLPFFRTKYTLKRDEGIFMIGLYLIYIYYLWPK
jgi:cation:H+ antiporter